MEALPVQRPRSIRSVASNSSIASGVSLSRRSRTRTRSKTVTGSSRPEDVPRSPLPSDLPYLGGDIVQEPEDVLDAPLQDSSSALPDRPPRSPQRLLEQAGDIRSTDTASSQDASLADPTFVEPTQSTALSSKPSKAAKQASSLPHLDTGYRPPPSAFSRVPALTPVINARDSVSTQLSGVSSSLYPPSTSTASAPESPTSPRSMAAEIEAPQFALEVNEVQEYDSDDVSYRLRLLVKNNYFLPPAHSKPSAADFAPPMDPLKKSPRLGPPTFLDIFRVGKSRSKPTTPTGAVPGYNSMAPMLRTTSEAIAAPHALRQPPPRPSGQFGHPSPPLGAPPPRGRVVVVREKMHDIAVAAKQAEQDLKARGVRIDQGSQKSAPATDNHVIDPTDAVDIPLLSPSYPFAVQASALHGLGVLESLGADVLADHLPPSQNPNLSVSYDEVEDSWRKGILKQAVHHSLDNTPDASSFSHVIGTSTPLESPQARGPDAPRVSAAQKLINQRIVALPIGDDEVDKIPTKHVRRKSAQSQASTSKGKSKLSVPTTSSKLDSRPASYQRAETPSGPMTPLQPPPRRAFMNPVYSMSQTDLSPSSSPSPLPADGVRRTLRRTVSSPLLAEGYDSLTSRHSVMTPPPLPGRPRDSQATFTSFNTISRNYDVYGAPSDHQESDAEGGRAVSFRSFAMSRPSLSEYSQASLSPTTSAFQDMLNHESHSSSSGNGLSRFSVEQQHTFSVNPAARAIAMSPPPRMSSSLAHVALPPPPRASSFAYRLGNIGSGTSLSRSGSRSYRTPQPESEESEFQILAPEPSTPPFPLPEGRGFSNRSAIYIDDSVDLSSALHSAPGPSSPTSFFDSLQAQPNAMDDLESSSDESDDEEPGQLPPIQAARIFSDSRTRATSSASEGARPPPFMRHGNLSTPYIRPETSKQSSLPIGNINSRLPIANNPIRPSKSDIIASSDFFKYAQDHPPTTLPILTAGTNDSRHPSTTDQDVNAWRSNQRAQESLRKLDGMLIQHMEDEKDTIKRIATTLKQSAGSQPGAPAYR